MIVDLEHCSRCQIKFATRYRSYWKSTFFTDYYRLGIEANVVDTVFVAIGEIIVGIEDHFIDADLWVWI